MQIPYNCQHNLELVIQRSSTYDAQYLVADMLIGLLAVYIVYVVFCTVMSLWSKMLWPHSKLLSK